MTVDSIKYNCHLFKGEIPCKPNKEHNCTCNNCSYYQPITTSILIIKLGAMGDVIRSTPLIHKYRSQYPGCHITWITHTPEILPVGAVDKIYKFNFEAVYSLTHKKFDIAVNLDKDFEACALLTDVNATNKFGFILQNNHIYTANPLANHKLITGAFDNISKQNTKHYMHEIFEICGFEFNNEPYILDPNIQFNYLWENIKTQAGNKKIIGLNTGCGKRWLTRLWPENYWIELIKQLQQAGYYPLLMGGPDEDLQNKKYAEATNAPYPGTFTLQQFISLSNQCHLIVTAVSMMMHIAVALKKPLVLFNNIFNPHEFYLYNNGIIVEPPTGCDCYYGNTCKRNNHCMNDIPVNTIFNAIEKLVVK